ncbi:MAG: hypothetical protein KDK70_24695 [Myxococcales bacterium]|nr:hypothetical protein [Myxococcales bacterium]
MMPWPRMIPLALPLALGACLVPPTEISGDTTGDGTATTLPSTDGGPTTNPQTSNDTTAATQGETTSDATSSPTTGVDTGDTSTAEGGSSESSSSGAPPQCEGGCGSNQVCNDGQCESVCAGGWGLGTWNYCLNDLGGFDTAAACGGSLPGYDCLNFETPIVAVTCSTQGCTGPCECPAPPPTGTATVACGPINGDVIDDCYLSCENNETCPMGMSCREDRLCVYTPPNLPMYGNCDAIAGSCMGGQCLYTVATGHYMCVSTCNNAGECDPSPPGSTNGAACGNVLDPPIDNGDECFIPCSNDNDCPYTMECFNNSLCMWPPP